MHLGQRLGQIAVALVGDDDDEPVSAMRKFAPVMPTSAARNFSAGSPRLGHQLHGSASMRVLRQLECGRRKSASTWSWVDG